MKMMEKLDHENIIKLICFKTGVYIKKNSKRNYLIPQKDTKLFLIFVKEI